MKSKARLLGHPIHPMLVVLPLGLFIAAAAFDGLYYWRGDTLFATLSYYNIAGGILGGLLAAVFGLRDWLAIPSGTRAKRIGLFHGALNVTMVMLFAAVWIARSASARLRPDHVRARRRSGGDHHGSDRRLAGRRAGRSAGRGCG